MTMKQYHCFSDLKSVTFTTNTTNIKSDLGIVSRLGSQCPEIYNININIEKWEEWKNSFEHQTGNCVVAVCGCQAVED